MRFAPGLYMTSHEGCSRYNAHRHPVSNWESEPQVRQPRVETPQPRTVTFDVPATVTYEVVVDVDGRTYIRAASFAIRDNDELVDSAPKSLYAEAYAAEDQLAPETEELFEAADATWRRCLDAALSEREGECAVGPGWSYVFPAPVLDEGVPS